MNLHFFKLISVLLVAAVLAPLAFLMVQKGEQKKVDLTLWQQALSEIQSEPVSLKEISIHHGNYGLGERREVIEFKEYPGVLLPLETKYSFLENSSFNLNTFKLLEKKCLYSIGAYFDGESYTLTKPKLGLPPDLDDFIQTHCF